MQRGSLRMREGLRANRPEDRHQGLKEYVRELVGEDCDIKPKCPTLLIMLYLALLFYIFCHYFYPRLF